MTYKETKERFVNVWNTNAYLNICESSDMENVIKALDKQIPKKFICEGNDESDWVYCPYCKDILGINESVYDEFYYNNFEVIYCPKCGQALTWE